MPVPPTHEIGGTGPSHFGRVCRAAVEHAFNHDAPPCTGGSWVRFGRQKGTMGQA